MPELVFAGTGHRPDKLGGYGLPAQMELTLFAGEMLCQYKPDWVISGMALGWDQALATACTRLGIPWTAAVPFQGQESRWSDQLQADYRELLGQARKVVYVSPPGYAAWKMQKRNEYMVRWCHTVLALWNGSGGGTANCVRYAQAQGRPVVNVWDQWAALRPEQLALTGV
jgi:uncharacterized phage-like protein YoqJ